MNPSSEGAVIRESRILSAHEKLNIFIAVVFVSIILGFAWYSWHEYQKNLPVALLSDSLNTESQLGANIGGALFFSAHRIDDEFRIPEIYKYDFADNATNLAFDLPAYSYAPGNSDSDFDLAVVYVEGTEDHEGYQPVSIDRASKKVKTLPNNLGLSTTDLTFSPDGKYYAYSFKTSNKNSSNTLSNWNIAIYNYETGTMVTVPSAAKPEFIHDGANLVYMTTNGLFVYNLASAEIYLLTSLYQNLTSIDDYAISNDPSTLVMAIPSLHLISVLNLNTSDLQMGYKEVGVIKSENMSYRFPVISPDKKFFVVMAANKDNFDSGSSSYKKISAEIRSVSSQEVIKEINFDGLNPESVVTEEWVTK